MAIFVIFVFCIVCVVYCNLMLLCVCVYVCVACNVVK